MSGVYNLGTDWVKRGEFLAKKAYLAQFKKLHGLNQNLYKQKVEG